MGNFNLLFLCFQSTKFLFIWTLKWLLQICELRFSKQNKGLYIAPCHSPPTAVRATRHPALPEFPPQLLRKACSIAVSPEVLPSKTMLLSGNLGNWRSFHITLQITVSLWGCEYHLSIPPLWAGSSESSWSRACLTTLCPTSKSNLFSPGPPKHAPSLQHYLHSLTFLLSPQHLMLHRLAAVAFLPVGIYSTQLKIDAPLQGKREEEQPCG